MTRAAVFVPVLLRFEPAASRRDGWGRLTVLTAGGAELSTGVRLLKGERVLLTFELGGAEHADVRARVERAEDDADGRRLAELRFEDPVQRRVLARALTDVLARS